MTFAIAWAFLQRGVSGLLTFFSTTVGKWIAAALGLVLYTWIVHHHGYKQGVSVCETSHAEAAAQELARQKAVFIDANTRAVARSVITEKKNTANQTRIVYVKEQAAAMPGASDVCLDAATADGVRSIN